jgi:hypothetical protein
MCALPNSSPRFRQICFVDLEANKLRDAAIFSRDRRISDAEKWI